jgi:hypothetical protein
MSTITVTNIKKTGETVGRDVSGVAAAWVNFNGQGTVAIRDSLNVASITDNGSGDYTVNFSNAFGAADYTSSSLGRLNTSVSNYDFPLVGIYRGDAYLAASSRVVSIFRSSATNVSGASDPDILAINFHGDLA